ncbi:MAG: hypothetical protein ThorAB25_19530 [Candidatus Thorarchaeota archaeon AB_25]|nr:MAG: hypothetical protein ThorAB25_19530 [Candidatus Thorarchaeota archaeon AB_25]
MINLGNLITLAILSRKDRASKINRGSSGLCELTVHPLLVSTISLGQTSTLEQMPSSEKILVQASFTERYRGVAGTVKVTYS